PDAGVLDRDSDLALLLRVEDAVGVARGYAVIDRRVEDGDRGRDGEVLHDAGEGSRALVRRDGAAAGAALREGARHDEEVFVVRGVRRGECGVALLGVSRVRRGQLQAALDIVAHTAAGLLERIRGVRPLRVLEDRDVGLPQHRRPYLAGVMPLRVAAADGG